jgi:hypothetical protein
MDRGTVFYSWQSDSSPKVTRNLIERALEMAAQRTNAALDAGYAGSGFMVRPLLPLFAHFDPLYMGWNPDRDARQLAVELMRRDGFHVTTLGDELRWPVPARSRGRIRPLWSPRRERRGTEGTERGERGSPGSVSPLFSRRSGAAPEPARPRAGGR